MNARVIYYGCILFNIELLGGNSLDWVTVNGPFFQVPVTNREL